MKCDWLNKDASAYGIINVSVANLRSQPVYQSELMNQLILGTIVPIFEEQNDFCYVQNWDGYFGWINKNGVFAGDLRTAERWQNADRLMVLENYGVFRKNEDTGAEVITDLVSCAILERLDGDSTLTKVGLPDGRIGFVETSNLIQEKIQLRVKATQKGIVSVAKKFLGIPYLWGGTSTKGFDCSGFVQTVFRLHNISLYRDARQMVEMGEEISINPNFDNLEIGDLIFFGKTTKRITHVGISLGKDLFIHSQASVQINSLNEKDLLFDEYRRKTFLKARRILPETART